MKKLIPIILLSVIAMVVACSHGTHHRQLVLVDSLMSHSLTDSAFHIFKQIDRDELGREGYQMYYDLLKAIFAQNPTLSEAIHFDEPCDSVFQKCINYFLQHHDQRKLLYSYLYLGKYYLLNQDKKQKATSNLKCAENLLSSVNDLQLAYLTNEALATLNYYSGNQELSMYYSYKTLTCAEKLGKFNELSHAYNHLVVLYLSRQMPDSALKYSNRSMSILSYMLPKNRSFALTNLALIYMKSNQLDTAQAYLEKALLEYPHPSVNMELAEISYMRGNHALADSLWARALHTTDLIDRFKVFQSMANKKYDNGDYLGTADAAARMLELKDSLAEQMQTAEVQEIQLKYDKEVERRKLDRFMMWALVAALVLLALIAAGVIYHIRKANRSKEKMMRDQVLINDYQRQIEELERSGEDTSKDIQALRKKMDALQAQQTEKLSEGRELYERIVAGESAVAWSKEQLQKFTEYYKVVNLPFMLQMEQDYMRLSPGNRFFLILQDMGMSDEQMTHILGVSDGALRTTRSRLRQKRTPAPQQ